VSWWSSYRNSSKDLPLYEGMALIAQYSTVPEDSMSFVGLNLFSRVPDTPNPNVVGVPNDGVANEGIDGVPNEGVVDMGLEPNKDGVDEGSADAPNKDGADEGVVIAPNRGVVDVPNKEEVDEGVADAPNKDEVVEGVVIAPTGGVVDVPNEDGVDEGVVDMGLEPNKEGVDESVADAPNEDGVDEGVVIAHNGSVVDEPNEDGIDEGVIDDPNESAVDEGVVDEPNPNVADEPNRAVDEDGVDVNGTLDIGDLEAPTAGRVEPPCAIGVATTGIVNIGVVAGATELAVGMLSLIAVLLMDDVPLCVAEDTLGWELLDEPGFTGGWRGNLGFSSLLLPS
jgi:hypothetical protein